MEEKKQPITIGQRFRHKRKRIIYVVRDVSDGIVLLVSENGEAVTRIQLDSLSSGGFEPLYD